VKVWFRMINFQITYQKSSKTQKQSKTKCKRQCVPKQIKIINLKEHCKVILIPTKKLIVMNTYPVFSSKVFFLKLYSSFMPMDKTSPQHMNFFVWLIFKPSTPF
jgi:hypothetical protein